MREPLQRSSKSYFRKETTKIDRDDLSMGERKIRHFNGIFTGARWQIDYEMKQEVFLQVSNSE